MPILPSAASYEELGGTINDYTEIVDPTTDLPAAASNATRANVAAMSRLAPRLFIIWSNNGTTAAISEFDSVVGNSDVYRPTIAKQATGRWRFTFPAYVNDFLGAEQPWAFRYGEGSALHNEPIHMQVIKVAPNIVDVYMWALPTAIANDVGGVALLVRVF